MLAQEKVRKDIMTAMVARTLMQAMAVIHGRTTMTLVETKYHVVMKLAMDLQQQDGLGPMMAKGAQVEDGKRIRTMFPSSLVRPLHEGDVGSVVLVASSSSNNHDGGRGRFLFHRSSPAMWNQIPFVFGTIGGLCVDGCGSPKSFFLRTSKHFELWMP